MKIKPRIGFCTFTRWYREINGKKYRFEVSHHGNGDVEIEAYVSRDHKSVLVHRLYFRKAK